MPNRLATSQSLYLQKHAHNPIDWWPWCAEALATAKRDNKPIFLSIGYSSCHWCTVMEGEAFSDPEIADYLNTHFLPIKVDREERPDLDSIYMQALQMMVAQGGWPLNIWLDPHDLVPFYGGTYFSVDARYGRPGFLRILQALREHYDTQPEQVSEVKSQILATLQSTATPEAGDLFDRAIILNGWRANVTVLEDSRSSNRFPMIPYADFLLRGYRVGHPDAWDEDIPPALLPSLQQGLCLALGGINDHVGGGFHRYTVDPTWTVPHFEKMLYDNGQIVGLMANLWSAGAQDPALRSGIYGAIDWLKREMTATDGSFYAAQDADNFTEPTAAEPEEGAFYTWGWAELEQLLDPEQLSALVEAFTVSVPGNFEGANVLQRRSNGVLSDRVLAALDRLFVARYGQARSTLSQFPPARNAAEAKTRAWPGRIPPVTDTKLIVAWNGLMVAGLARVAAVFQDPAVYRLAAGAAAAWRDRQWVGDRFHRLAYDGQPTIPAQAEDYAEAIRALLELHQAATALVAIEGADLAEAADWLALAQRLQTEFDRHLWDNETGGYFNAEASPDAIVRERSTIDNATPAPNGTALQNLVRLALLTEDLTYLDRAEQGFRAFYGLMNEHPRACPSLLSALDCFQRPVLVRAGAATLAELAQHYLPTTLLRLDDQLPEGAIALVCQGLTCLPAATDRDQLWELLRQSQG
jgi:uncharacterized protein YyaL (SSP411 family)